LDNRLLVFNGKIIAESGVVERGYVLTENGKIVSIGDNWENIKYDKKVDAKGLIISPGFVDMHTHGIMDTNFLESNSNQIVQGLKAYTEYGVTTVIGSTLSNPFDSIIQQLKNIRGAMEDAEFGDVLSGIHIEGPWLSPRCKGGHPLQYLRIPEKEEVYKLLEEGADIIKTVTFAPELPNAVWLTEELTKKDILPVIGHTEASFEEAEKVILAGARHVTHMFDGMLGFKENPNEALVMMPGVETAVLLNDSVSIELIGCPVHVSVPFFKLIDKIKPYDKKVVITDSLIGTGKPDGTVIKYKDGKKVIIKEKVFRMIDDDPTRNGNLTGSAVTMNVAIKRLREFANLTTTEAIKWGTINPAKVLGIDKILGSIKVGKVANITIIDNDFNVKRTFLKGKEIYSA